jgi:hypothetical protein
MSSYICSPKHFNSIEEKLKNLVYDSNFYLPYSLKDILPKWYNKKDNSFDVIFVEIKNIINSLRELNVLCVSLQYKNHYVGRLDQEIENELVIVKQKTEIKGLSKHGLYNALSCLNYQIELEHLKDLRNLTLEEENAMKFLKEFKISLAEDIIRELEEDKTNTWSID